MSALIPAYQIQYVVTRVKCLGMTRTNVKGKRYVPTVDNLNILLTKQIVNIQQSALTAGKTIKLTHSNARPGILKTKKILKRKLSIPGTYHSLRRGKLLKAIRKHPVKVMLALRRRLMSQYHVLMLRHKQTLYLSQELLGLRLTMLHQPKHLLLHETRRNPFCKKRES